MMDISQQPDFARIASSLRVAADETARCQNLEPVQQHASIVAMFNTLREDMQSIRQEQQAMEQRLIQFIRQEQREMEQHLHMRIAARYVLLGLLFDRANFYTARPTR